MSSPNVRELNEIQNEFQNVCAKAGHAQYQIEVFKKELDGLNKRLLDLNKEAHARRLLDSKEGKRRGVEVELPEAPQQESKPEEPQQGASNE